MFSVSLCGQFCLISFPTDIRFGWALWSSSSDISLPHDTCAGRQMIKFITLLLLYLLCCYSTYLFCGSLRHRINYRVFPLSRFLFCFVFFCCLPRSFFHLTLLRKVRQRCSHSIFSYHRFFFYQNVGSSSFVKRGHE